MRKCFVCTSSSLLPLLPATDRIQTRVTRINGTCWKKRDFSHLRATKHQNAKQQFALTQKNKWEDWTACVIILTHRLNPVQQQPGCYSERATVFLSCVILSLICICMRTMTCLGLLVVQNIMGSGSLKHNNHSSHDCPQAQNTYFCADPSGPCRQRWVLTAKFYPGMSFITEPLQQTLLYCSKRFVTLFFCPQRLQKQTENNPSLFPIPRYLVKKTLPFLSKVGKMTQLAHTQSQGYI